MNTQNTLLDFNSAKTGLTASGSRENLSDRRNNQRSAAFQSWFRNRRIGTRRARDVSIGRYVDIHESWLMFLCLYIIGLSTLDAFLTLHLLELGSNELNPFMDYLIKQNHQLFLSVKLIISAACLLILVMHKNFKLFGYITGYHILFAYAALYSTLVSYELTMLVNLTVTL